MKRLLIGFCLGWIASNTILIEYRYNLFAVLSNKLAGILTCSNCSQTWRFRT